MEGAPKVRISKVNLMHRNRLNEVELQAKRIRGQIEKESTSTLETADVSTLCDDLYLSSSDDSISTSDGREEKESETEPAAHLKPNDFSILSADLYLSPDHSITTPVEENNKESEREQAVDQKSNDIRSLSNSSDVSNTLMHDWHISPDVSKVTNVPQIPLVKPQEERIPLVFSQKRNHMDLIDKIAPETPKLTAISHGPPDIVPSRKYSRTRPSAFARKSGKHPEIGGSNPSSQNMPSSSVPVSLPSDRVGNISSQSSGKVRISNVNSMHGYTLSEAKEQATRMRDRIQAEACKKKRGRKSTKVPTDADAAKVSVQHKISNRGEKKKGKVVSSESRILELCRMANQKSSSRRESGILKTEIVPRLDINKSDTHPHRKINADISAKREIIQNYGNSRRNDQVSESASSSRLTEKEKKPRNPSIQTKNIVTTEICGREKQNLLTPIGMKGGVYSLGSHNLHPSSPQKAVNESSEEIRKSEFTSKMTVNLIERGKKRKAQEVETMMDPPKIASRVDTSLNIHGTARVVVNLFGVSNIHEFSSRKRLKIENESKDSESQTDSWAVKLVKLGVLQPLDESGPQFFPIKTV